MRAVHRCRTTIVAIGVLLAGCGTPAPTPLDTTTASMPASSGAPSVPAQGPPLAGDLIGGTSVPLGSAGHWAITGSTAFVALDEGTVVALDLATGSTDWQARFTLGQPWDSQPTLGLSADQNTVIAVRTVDIDGATALNLLLLNAADGHPLAEQLLSEPTGEWTIDLPPKVMAADNHTIVLTDNPESGLQTVVVRVDDGTLAWRVDEQAVAATTTTVVTRGGGWSREDGTSLWRTAEPLGPLLAQSVDGFVVQSAQVGIWLDLATGLATASTGQLREAEPPCVNTVDTLICLNSGVTGYDLASADQLWSSPVPAEAAATLMDWVYLWRGDGRGDVRNARTGKVVVEDAALPALRHANGSGVLLATDQGYAWVPFPR